MSVVQYWRERLAAKVPLHSTHWVSGTDYKPHRAQDRIGSWPHSVCRDVLYRDYCLWHHEVFLSPYRKSDFFADVMPEPADSFTFFTTMSPWLYIAGKEVQVRNYSVWVEKDHEGRRVAGKKWRYFVRLCLWETHCTAFEMISGVTISGTVKFFNAERAKRMDKEVSDFRESAAGG